MHPRNKKGAKGTDFGFERKIILHNKTTKRTIMQDEISTKYNPEW